MILEDAVIFKEVTLQWLESSSALHGLQWKLINIWNTTRNFTSKIWTSV